MEVSQKNETEENISPLQPPQYHSYLALIHHNMNAFKSLQCIVKLVTHHLI